MNQLLTVKELSLFLHMHPKTVYKWIDAGKIPYLKINGLIRFVKREIEEWQENRKVKNIEITKLLPNFDLSLENYDKMHLKGRSALSNKNLKRWSYGFGSVFTRKMKSGNVRWYIDYRKANGERVREVVPNAQAREEALVVLKNEVLKTFYKKNGIKCREKMSFRRFSEIYLNDYAKEEKKSWMTDEFRLRKLIEFFKDTELRDITSSMIRKFRTWRLEEGNSGSTSNRYLALLKRMFNFAIEEGYIAENPVKKVKFLSEENTLKEQVLSADEERRLLEASSERLRPIVSTALNTGMRRGEILNLKWKNVDLNKRIIVVEKTKSGKVRFVPINEVLYGELLRLRRENKSEEFVFPFCSVRTAFENARERARLKIRFHDLRHTFASRLVEEGVDIVTVQSLLGHYSVSVTQRYTHSCDERKRRAVELLSRIEPKGEEREPGLSRPRHIEKDKPLKVFRSSLFSVN